MRGEGRNDLDEVLRERREAEEEEGGGATECDCEEQMRGYEISSESHPFHLLISLTSTVIKTEVVAVPL